MSCLCCDDADMAPLSDFVPFVSPSLTDAPDTLIQQFVRQAAIAFSRELSILKDTVTVDLQANVHDYTFDVGNPCLFARSAGEVRICGGRPLPRLRTRPNPGECDPAGFWLNLPNEVYVIPHPRADVRDGLSIELILQPAQDASSLPRAFYDEFAELLADGALSRLLLLKDADWFDPRSAGIALKRYQKAVGSVRLMLQRGDDDRPLMAKAPRWV